MKIEDFINEYSTEYRFVFHGVVETKEPKKSTLSKISDFLFEPRYEVNNLQFKIVA